MVPVLADCGRAVAAVEGVPLLPAILPAAVLYLAGTAGPLLFPTGPAAALLGGLDTAEHTWSVATAPGPAPRCARRLLPEIIVGDQIPGFLLRQELGSNLEEVLAVEPQSLDKAPVLVLCPLLVQSAGDRVLHQLLQCFPCTTKTCQ